MNSKTCGVPNGDDAKSCISCGAELHHPELPPKIMLARSVVSKMNAMGGITARRFSLDFFLFIVARLRLTFFKLVTEVTQNKNYVIPERFYRESICGN